MNSKDASLMCGRREFLTAAMAGVTVAAFPAIARTVSPEQVTIEIADLDCERAFAVCYQGRCIGAGFCTPSEPWIKVRNVPLDDELVVLVGDARGGVTLTDAQIRAFADADTNFDVSKIGELRANRNC